MRRRLRNKLRSNRGFTLVEMISTLAIVVLITMLVAVGVSLATRTYSQSVELSEAKVLHSTLSSVISNELAQTSTIKPDPKTPVDGGYKLGKFFSRNYGVEDDLCSFRVISSDGKDYGEIALGSSTTQNRLLSSGAYTNGTGAKVSAVYYEDGAKSGEPAHFEVTLDVYNKDGDKLVSSTFDVVPYNSVNVDKS